MKTIFVSAMVLMFNVSAFAMDCPEAQLQGHQLVCETQYLYELSGRSDIQNPPAKRVLTVEFEAINEHEPYDAAPECKASATVVDSLTGYKFNAHSDSQKRITVTFYQGPQNETLFSNTGISKEGQDISSTLYLSQKNIFGPVASSNGFPVSMKLSKLQLSCRIQ